MVRSSHSAEAAKLETVFRSYFDHNATTNLAPAVLRELPALLAEVYGNASSIHHFGQAAKQKLEGARRQIAAALGCNPREITFTSGGTESDNLALFGVVRASPASRKHVITSAIEHPAILNTCAQLERAGVSVTYLPVGRAGQVDPDDLRSALRPETAAISIMHANNETGVLQPIAELADIAREAGVPLHSDGVQTAGRIPVNITALGVDLYSISGHKLGAPKGIGALYIRRDTPLEPILFGGHHERDRRAGTENVPGAAALALAFSEPDWLATAVHRDRLERAILDRVPFCTVNGCAINGSTAERLPNTTNICFEGIEGEAMVIALDLKGCAVSSGSACSSGAVEPSHVLLSMGLSRANARSSVRFSLGLSNTCDEIERLIEAVITSAAHLRRISPALVTA